MLGPAPIFEILVKNGKKASLNYDSRVTPEFYIHGVKMILKTCRAGTNNTFLSFRTGISTIPLHVVL